MASQDGLGASPSAAPPATAAAAGSSSSSSRSAKDWFGAAGDGGAARQDVSAALRGIETKAAVSAIKSKLAAKLSKPKGSSSGGIAAEGRKTGLTKEERERDQQRHEAKLLSQGKAVPHYRKQAR